MNSAQLIEEMIDAKAQRKRKEGLAGMMYLEHPIPGWRVRYAAGLSSGLDS